jgi:hypothetical protein
VSGFSTTVFPPRLVAASFSVREADVEGDCGGYRAVERLPTDGAYVVLIDYGEIGNPAEPPEYTARLPVTLGDGRLANFECFGESYLFRVVVAGRSLQLHLGLGRDSDADRRSEALSVVNSLRGSG